VGREVSQGLRGACIFLRFEVPSRAIRGEYRKAARGAAPSRRAVDGEPSGFGRLLLCVELRK
jgi:hypothetical protein